MILAHGDNLMLTFSSTQEKNKIDFGIFKLKEEPTVEPVTQGSLFSRFKSLKAAPSYDSTKTRKDLYKAKHWVDN